ncbi:MAG: hypothetical protein H7316_04040 [Tardiphaga sp.]|uniref:hypothetical protein n=1 Tax=Tardiphaga sp. TaxID=1926292 RepID=UPI001988EDA3|nr:hypothetical protein [Tardiphaga sp.]MBC7582902.1 hypothetical protein [Tardiphaga sp.]
MIRAWLDLPAFGVFATLFVLYFGAALALAGLIFRSPVLRGWAWCIWKNLARCWPHSPCSRPPGWSRSA